MENLNKLFVIAVLALFLTACAETQKEAAAGAGKESAVTEKGDAKSDLKDIIGAKVPTYMVTYDMSAEAGVSEITMYFKDGKIRSDVIANGQKASTFFIGDKMYSCTETPKAMCIVFTSAQKPTEQTDEMEANVDSYSIKELSPRRIAGEDTRCFAIKAEQTDMEACYARKGALLYSKSASAGKTFEMTATAYSPEVSDAVFDLPAQPQDINAMMAQYQQ